LRGEAELFSLYSSGIGPPGKVPNIIQFVNTILFIKNKICPYYRGTPTLTPILTEQTEIVSTLQSQLTASKQQVAKQALEQAKLEKTKQNLLKAKESLTKKVLELEAKLATNSPKDSLLQSLKNQLQEALAKLAKKEQKINPSAILEEIRQFISTADSLDSIES
jgi:hypothetical protein